MGEGAVGVAADRESYLSPSDDRATVDLVSVAAFQGIRVAWHHLGAVSVGDVTADAGGGTEGWKGCKE